MTLTVRENFNTSSVLFDRNNLSQRYKDLRYNLLAAVEGVRPRPYYDSAGLLSIGIGFNLIDQRVLGFVLDELGIPAAKARRKGERGQARIIMLACRHAPPPACPP